MAKRRLNIKISSFCAANGCVGIAQDPDGVHVFDTKGEARTPPLSFTREEWTAFVAGVKNGEFDLE